MSKSYISLLSYLYRKVLMCYLSRLILSYNIKSSCLACIQLKDICILLYLPNLLLFYADFLCELFWSIPINTIPKPNPCLIKRRRIFSYVSKKVSFFILFFFNLVPCEYCFMFPFPRCWKSILQKFDMSDWKIARFYSFVMIFHFQKFPPLAYSLKKCVTALFSR